MDPIAMVNDFLQDILKDTFNTSLKRKPQTQTSKIPIKQQSTLYNRQMYPERDIISSYWTKRDVHTSRRREVDIRCIDNMKSFRNKIKSYCSGKQNKCDCKDYREQQQQTRSHRGHRGKGSRKIQGNQSLEGLIHITPIKPNMSFVKESPTRLVTRSSHTKAIMNIEDNTDKRNKRKDKNSAEKTASNLMISAEAITSSLSKQKLHKKVTEWINKFDLYTNNSFDLNKENIINTFIETAHKILSEVNNTDIERKLNTEIVKSLDKLKMLSSSSGVSQDASEATIVEDLKNNIIAWFKDSIADSSNRKTINKNIADVNKNASDKILVCKTPVAVNTVCETKPDFKTDSFSGRIKAQWTTCRKSIKTGLDFDFNLEKSLSREIQLVLDKIGFELSEVEIADVISKLIISAIYSKADVESVKTDICNALYSYVDLPSDKEESIADSILDNVTLEISDNSVKIKHRTFEPHESQFSGVITVYTSEEKINSPKHLATSTPKRKNKKKEIPEMNKEETEYYDKIEKIITKWMDTLPKQFNKPEDKSYKDTMIKDLCGILVDEVKEEQIYPKYDLELTLKIAIMKWTEKFSIYETREESLDKVAELYEQIMEIPTPNLTTPHHGNRQEMENLKYIERDNLLKPDYIPPGGLHIEDEISIWMNEQPDDIYTFKDRTERNNGIHNLAEHIHQIMLNNEPEAEIKKEIEKWLKNVITYDEKVHMAELVEELKNRVKNIPLQDAIEKTMQDRILSEEAQRSFKISKHTANLEEPSMDQIDPNTTLQDYISKFIEHNCNVADKLRRGALRYFLKKELIKLSAPTRKELYDNFSKSKHSVEFLSDRFFSELDYMCIVSDWLHTLPLHPSYKRRGNNHRIEFITNVVTYIADIEEERKANPNAMNYDEYLADIVDTYVRLLSIPKEQQYLMRWEIKSLISNLTEFRMKNQNTITLPKANAPDLDAIINEFIEKYATDEDDPLKMEVYTARLMEEAKRIIHETSNPEALSKTQVYNQLHAIAHPGNQTLDRFEHELTLIEEITDWLLNLPLLLVTNENDEENRAAMVSELSEKLYDRYFTNKKADDAQADEEVVQYIKNWIGRLPLDKNQELLVPVVVKQLISRIEKSNKKNESGSSLLNESAAKRKKSASVKCNTACPKSKHYQKDPAKYLLEELNKFVNGLPIKGSNDEDKKELKDNLVTKLFKEIGNLNNDSNVFNNDHLYREMLTNVVEINLQDLSETPKNLEKLKTSLIDNSIDIKNAIKEKITGDVYRKTLEDTVDASIPNPIPHQVFHPGFEIYKERLVEMFILDNFDQSNDDIKLKYEQRLKSEIDKYFQSAQNINFVPVTKEQFYNELYSALFKVPIPNEISVIEVLEEVKTRCVIDEWFESLPITTTDDLILLLEWDKLLATLAKRICEIERNEQKPDDKIKKEIKKVLEKLPLLPGNDNKSDEYANKLFSVLKSNTGRRRSTSKERRSSKGKGKSKSKTKMSSDIAVSSKNTDPTTAPALSDTNINDELFYKSPADLIVEIVNKWCDDLPLDGTSQELEMAKQFISLKLLMKISELNSNVKIFADDYVYNVLLDEELEKLLSVLPATQELLETKEDLKNILKEQIGYTKCLVANERARYDYKQNLKNTVKSILEEPKHLPQTKADEYKDLIEEIIDGFLLYYYQNIGIEEKQVFKVKLYDALVQYFTILDIKGDVRQMDRHMLNNLILCELAKVPAPNPAAVYHELGELVLKNDVKEFIVEVAITDKELDKSVILKNDIHRTISNKLLDLQGNGFKEVDDDKLKIEINKCLKKFNKEANSALVDKLVRNIKGGKRKLMPLGEIKGVQNGFQTPDQSFVYNWHKQLETPPPSQPQRRHSSMDTENSLLPIQRRSQDENTVSFSRFKTGVVLSSSKNNPQPQVASTPGFESRSVPSSGENVETTEETNFRLPPSVDDFPNIELLPEFERIRAVLDSAPKRQSNENEEENICMCIKKKIRNSRRPCLMTRLFYEDFDDCRPLPRGRCRMPLTGYLIY